jgi:hypothetical protein
LAVSSWLRSAALLITQGLTTDISRLSSEQAKKGASIETPYWPRWGLSSWPRRSGAARRPPRRNGRWWSEALCRSRPRRSSLTIYMSMINTSATSLARSRNSHDMSPSNCPCTVSMKPRRRSYCDGYCLLDGRAPYRKGSRVRTRLYAILFTMIVATLTDVS